MPARDMLTSLLLGRGGKKDRTTRIVLAALGLGAMAYFLWPRTDAALQRVRRTAPDSLSAYMLKPEERAVLAEFYQARQTFEASALQRWVYKHRSRVQCVGLQLAEQGMLFRWRAQSPLAEAKFDTAFHLGRMLAAAAQDSFSLRHAERIKNLDAHGLAARAKVSETFALARHLFLQKNYAEAAEWLERVRAQAQKAGEDKFFMEASYLLQYALRRQPQHVRVITLGAEILRQARHSGYRICLAPALAEVADAYFEMALNDSAIAIVNRAITFGEGLGDTVGLARCHFSRAQIYARVGNYAEAEHSIVQVLRFDALQRYRGQILSLQGQIAMMRCEYGRAEELLRETLQIHEAREDHGNRIQTLIDLSVVKTLIGDFENALAFGRQAYAISVTADDRLRGASALGQLGWIHLQSDSLPQAVAALKKALALFSAQQHRMRANTWITLGNAHLKRRDFTSAHSAFLRAEELAQAGDSKIIEIESRIGQGWVTVAEGRPLQAQAWFASALDLAKRLHEESLAGEALFGIAEAQKQAGNFEEALATLDRALAIGETLRAKLAYDSSRVSYFSARQDWFEAAIHLALELNQPELAFYYAERARARVMRDALAAAEERGKEAAGFDLPATAELQRRIPANVQVLEYRLTENALLVWLVENDKLLLRRVAVTAQALADTIRRFRRSLGAEDYDDFRRRCKENLAEVYRENRGLGKELYNVLLAPFARELEAGKRLYLIPDGPLHLAPWGALVDAGDNFFDETHAWIKAPSLAILTRETGVHDHTQRRAELRLLMVAGDLASTAAQKNALKKSFPGMMLLQGAEANFENVQQALAAGAEIAYFSVRGVADVRRPLNSYLELAEEGATNASRRRKVYVRELQAWDFTKVDLVILNACETASGKIEPGEGGMSLASFLARSRAPHIVASLWKNDDRVSARMMDDFLAAMKQHGDASAGLQHAKRAAIRELTREHQYPLPYFWATFELQDMSFSNSTHQPFN
jgi:CHAT domain-containing protein/TolA-binding protein